MGTPFRIRSNINLYKQKLFLQPVVGIVFGYDDDPITNGEISSGSGGSSSSTGYSSEDRQFRQTFANNYLLFETGLSLNYSFSNRFSFFVNASSFHGNKTISKVRVEFEDNTGVMDENTILDNGSCNAISFGLKMNLGKSKSQ